MAKSCVGDAVKLFMPYQFAVLASVALLCLAACQKTPSDIASKDAAPAAAADEGLTLSAEQIEKAGIKTTAAKAISYVPEQSGYGVVLGHDTIAQMVADISAARAAAAQSRAALQRLQRLAGTPGAEPAETQDTVQRQVAADGAALMLAQRRLSAAFGQNAPWQSDEGNLMLNALANGTAKLVRVTFPVGALQAQAPHRLRLGPLGANPRATDYETPIVWDAPADANVPGRSFFALLAKSNASEGEHLQVWAAAATPVAGVWVPASAVILSDEQYWCYVEKTPGKFERTSLDISSPTADGYFVATGIAAGDAVVASGVGLLLARETNPSTAAE
jgi:hypothetical protein